MLPSFRVTTSGIDFIACCVLCVVCCVLCVVCCVRPIKLKCFFLFRVIVCFQHQIHMNIRSFAGIYARKLRGHSRFIWTLDTLRIIVRGLFQFHRCGPSRVSLDAIAPHLRALVCERVKSLVCDSHSNPDFAEHYFEMIRARWICLPSVRAVLLKLRECERFASLVGSTEATYDSLRADGVMSRLAYDAFDSEITLRHFSHPGCHLRRLPAIPRPCARPSMGSCFYCGGGLTDKIDWNWFPKCECLGYEGGAQEVLVCSSCLEEMADD